ncbi:unnamed protein product [Polarella glacialis]|uniref:Uncharacterized protein n=1 Tax=Polarella glacialis TaxID=89957 RepID=A0A813IEU9_POLGL|nr:unnamed protein product [Polarella glacialis]
MVELEGIIVPPRCAERVMALESELQSLKEVCSGLEQHFRSQELALVSLRDTVNLKADAAAVSSTADFQGLMVIVESKADASTVPTTDQLQAIADALQGKADLSEVPTVVQFRILSDAVHRKPDSDLVPSLSQFQMLTNAVRCKADATAVPSSADLRALVDIVDLKADASKVPTNDRFQALCVVASQKADVSDVAVYKSEFQALDEAMRHMRRSIPSQVQLQALNTVLQSKAEVAEVPVSADGTPFLKRQRVARPPSTPLFSCGALVPVAAAGDGDQGAVPPCTPTGRAPRTPSRATKSLHA